MLCISPDHEGRGSDLLRFRLNPISRIAFRKSTVEGTYYLDENKGDFPLID